MSRTLFDFFGAPEPLASPQQAPHRERDWVDRACERDSAAVGCAVDWLVHLDAAAFAVALSGATLARPASNADSHMDDDAAARLKAELFPGAVARAIMTRTDRDRKVLLAAAALRYCGNSPAEAANKLRVFFLTFAGAHFFSDALASAADPMKMLTVVADVLALDTTGIPQTDWIMASTKLRDTLIAVGFKYIRDRNAPTAETSKCLAVVLRLLTNMTNACCAVQVLPIRAMDHGRANDALTVPTDALLLPEGWLCCGLPSLLTQVPSDLGEPAVSAFRRLFRAMCRLNHVSWHASLANKVRSVAGAGATTFGTGGGDWATLSEALAAVYLRLCGLSTMPLRADAPSTRDTYVPRHRCTTRRTGLAYVDVDTEMATDLAFMINGERLSYDPEPQATRKYASAEGPTPAEQLVQFKTCHFGASGNAATSPRVTSNTPTILEGPGLSSRVKGNQWPFLSGELQELFSKTVADHTSRLVDTLLDLLDGSPHKERRMAAAFALDNVIGVLRTLEEAQLLHIIIATDLHLLPGNILDANDLWRDWTSPNEHWEKLVADGKHDGELDETDVLFAPNCTPVPLVTKSLLLVRDMFRYEQRQRGTNALNSSERDTLDQGSPFFIAPVVHAVVREPCPWLLEEPDLSAACVAVCMSLCMVRSARAHAAADKTLEDSYRSLVSLVAETGAPHCQLVRELMACVEHRDMVINAKLLSEIFMSTLVSLTYSPLPDEPTAAELIRTDERYALAGALILRCDRPRHAATVTFMAQGEKRDLLLSHVDRSNHPELVRALGFLIGRTRTYPQLRSEYSLNPNAIRTFANGVSHIIASEPWTAAKSLVHCGLEIRHLLSPERSFYLNAILKALTSHPRENATDAAALLKCHMCLAERNASPNWAETPGNPMKNFPPTPTSLLLSIGELATQLVTKCADDTRRFSDALSGVLRLGTLVLHNDLTHRVELSLPRITKETARQFLFWPQKHECTAPSVVEEACLFAVMALRHDVVDPANVRTFLDEYAIPHVESTRGNVRPVCVCFLALRERIRRSKENIILPNIERLLALPPSIEYSDVISTAATPVSLLMKGMLHLHAGLACRAHAAVVPQLSFESVHELPDGVWESALTPAVAEAFYAKIANMLHATMFLSNEDDPTNNWRVPVMLLNRIACVMRQDHGPFYCTARFRSVLIAFARYAEHSPTFGHAFIGVMERFITCAPSIAVFLAVTQLQVPVETMHRQRVAIVPRALQLWAGEWALPYRMLPNRDETAHDAAGAAMAFTTDERESVLAGGPSFGDSKGWPEAEPFHQEPRPMMPRAAIGLAALPRAMVNNVPAAARVARIARLLSRNEKGSRFTAPPAQRMADRIRQWAPHAEPFSCGSAGVVFVRHLDPVLPRSYAELEPYLEGRVGSRQVSSTVTATA